jgi:glycosyltransferase involved in cell wall biosynthesis
MSAERIVALLGCRDEPTDGVADYCEWLGGGLAGYGYEISTVRVNWAELGWRAALADLREKAAAWRDGWVLMQYTTLAWSRRGFPLHAPGILAALRDDGVRCGVVFHDFAPLGGRRIIDRARSYCQFRVLRQLYEHAERAIFPVPLEMVPWLPQQHEKASFIPVGANCPQPPAQAQADGRETKTIAVYSVTGGRHTLLEVADIGCALKRARRAAGPLRLVVVGRGSQEADAALRGELAGTDVEVETFGLLAAEELSRKLAGADVLLFVRGQISSRRGSALAGIACGLPVVCYAGPETGGLITEVGLLAVPLRDRDALSAALERVLTDTVLRETLAERSRRAQEQYFSWPVIAAQFAAFLRGSVEGSRGGVSAERAAVARLR